MNCSTNKHGQSIFTISETVQNKIYDHFEQNINNGLKIQQSLTESAISQNKDYGLSLGYLNRVATKGNKEYGHISPALVFSSWVDFNTASSKSVYTEIVFQWQLI